MRIYEHKRKLYSSAREDSTFAVNLLTGTEPPHEPFIYFDTGGLHAIKLAEARKLARKILSIPTPIGFKDLPDNSDSGNEV